MSSGNGWIGVDLDGTLAHYDHWRGPDHIGEPIPEMVARVRQWLAAGRDVRIFTARVYCPPPPFYDDNGAEAQQWEQRNLEAGKSRAAIRKFCREQFGRTLEVTCTKDFSMIELYDDRAVQVVTNTGQLIQEVAEGHRLCLLNLASFDDESANERLERTGSYSLFDEPSSVQTAREHLEAFGTALRPRT